MEYFVSKNSVVRKIWGSSDTILFIFAGAAAEFALNKAVDWLYFTGRLPADPLGRLFSTVAYARQIVFSDKMGAYQAIDRMAAIHAAVENNRGSKIPDWAYRDVLFMLIDYSIRAYELMYHPLTEAEKTEVCQVFLQVGQRMGLRGLPDHYPSWLLLREQYLAENLKKSNYTLDLYRQYRKHLGLFRYFLLKQGQLLIVPKRVKNQLQLGWVAFLKPVVGVYKFSRLVKLDWLLKVSILPAAYKAQIKDLDKVPAYPKNF
ncbi:oxygenase MpaB family protein [Adhaeribacter pallidiroseus]|uniref:ER-bound oxygenase mpaB/mpaB'/Rubber oxygenase catalytic domain-containing protein n=1 Tax=Adhaeribacter pallidiroseus TaxID=2072847 RepID=A0A369QFF7_9BACT|nr:oxygenase MpaB family protein [Adhaeribacter pallidiroseus]RDC63162.1 hypothetical protein AHMF7616_01763 [Adhaeribacter pallidiroseus]